MLCTPPRHAQAPAQRRRARQAALAFRADRQSVRGMLPTHVSRDLPLCPSSGIHCCLQIAGVLPTGSRRGQGRFHRVRSSKRPPCAFDRKRTRFRHGPPRTEWRYAAFNRRATSSRRLVRFDIAAHTAVSVHCLFIRRCAPSSRAGVLAVAPRAIRLFERRERGGECEGTAAVHLVACAVASSLAASGCESHCDSARVGQIGY